MKTEIFHQKLKEILLSNAVKNYLTKKRKFIGNDCEVEIIENDGEYDDNLEEGYEDLIKKLKENIFYLNELII